MGKFRVHECEGVVYQGAWARTAVTAEALEKRRVARLRIAIAKRNRNATLGMTES